MLQRLDLTKELNRRLILEQIRRREPISRSEIVDATGLSKAAVSSIVAELMEARLVEEIGSQSTAIGRPRILLSLIPSAAFTVGAELTNQECRVMLTNLRAEPVARFVQPVTSADLSVESLLDILQSAVGRVTAGVDPEQILALGLCVPGIVDPATGQVAFSVLLPWRNVALGQTVAQRFTYPVAVFSRGNAATWGERWYGAGQTATNMLYVRVGTGIVGGLVINGQPYLGQGFGAGELGHITVQPDGALCRCGNQGCLATVATVDALLSRVSQLLRDNRDNALWSRVHDDLNSLTLEDVVWAAEAENPVALQGVAETGRWLAIAIASAVNLLNLDMVIIGGPLEQAGEKLLEPLRAELSQRALPTHLARVEVVPSALKEDAPSIGAASLVLHELMSPNPLPVALGSFTDRASLFALSM
jgi:predicted NBD/HSP70 family sugar kinase